MTDRVVSRRIWQYAAVFVLLSILGAVLHRSSWTGDAEFHTALEIVATLLALVAGLLAMVRYYARKSNTYLFITTGFMGTAALAGFHTVVTSSYFEAYFSSPLPTLAPSSERAAPIFLAMLLIMGWWGARRESRLGSAGRFNATAIYVAATILVLASFLLCALVPLPSPYYPDSPVSRPAELIAASMFLFALVGFLIKGTWKHDSFEHWLVLSLIVGLLCQAVFMSRSLAMFDTMFNTAHLLKAISYGCVVVGLLFNMYVLHGQVERSAAERKRAEEAMRRVVVGTSPKVGKDFFPSLVRHLAAALEVRYAFVAEMPEPFEGRVRLLTLWDGRGFSEPFEYDIKGTPCENVVGNQLAFFPDHIRERFPEDHWMRKNNIESYLAIPLFDSANHPIGHLGVMHNEPIVDRIPREAMLRIFAARAAAEMERDRAEKRLKSSEREARERFAQLQLLYDEAPLGLCFMDTELRYRRCNEKLAEINGIAAEDHLGKTLREIVPEIAESMESVYREVIASGRAIVDVLVTGATAADPKHARHFSACYYPIKSNDGVVIGVSSIVQDITERKHAELELQSKSQQLAAVTDAMAAYLGSGDWSAASEEILRSALSQTESECGFVGVVVSGPTLRVLAHEGIQWDIVVGKDVYEEAQRRYERLGYLEFTELDNLFGRVITDRKTIVANDPTKDPRAGNRRPSGHPAFRSFLGIPIIHGTEVVALIGIANRPGGYTGAEQDKLEILGKAAGVLYDNYRRRLNENELENLRREAEAALRESEHQLKLITDNVKGFIAYVDRDQRYRFVNKRYADAVGLTRSEIIGRHVKDVIGASAYGEIRKHLESALSGQPDAFEATLRFEHSETVCLAAAYVPDIDGDGQVRGLYALLSDVTDRKRAEEELRVAHVELERRVEERTAQLRRANAALEQEIDQRRQLEREILDVASEEQRRIAQDMHDGLGQELTALAFLGKNLERKLSARSLPEAAEGGEIVAHIKTAGQQLRRIVKGLYPADLDAGGFAIALEQLAREVKSRFGITCSFACRTAHDTVENTTRTHLYRIAREAVANAVKHSGARRIAVTLGTRNGALVLEVSDDGVGFAGANGAAEGMGLRMMRYRAGVIGASLDIENGNGNGTVVRCTLEKATEHDDGIASNQ